MKNQVCIATHKNGTTSRHVFGPMTTPKEMRFWFMDRAQTVVSFIYQGRIFPVLQ